MTSDPTPLSWQAWTLPARVSPEDSALRTALCCREDRASTPNSEGTQALWKDTQGHLDFQEGADSLALAFLVPSAGLVVSFLSALATALGCSWLTQKDPAPSTAGEGTARLPRPQRPALWVLLIFGGGC